MRPEEESKLINSIYDFFGEPKKVYQTKVVLYNGWNAGNIQRGRVFIYHLVTCPDMGPDKININSYFIKVLKKTCMVYSGNCNKEPDLVVNL